jgi:hypothetical protein
VNEQEWLEATDVQPMLEFLRGKVSDRKMRLFLIACCCRILPLLSDERSQRALEVANLFAEGEASVEDLIASREKACAVSKATGDATADFVVEDDEHEEPAYLPGFHAAVTAASAASAVTFPVMSPVMLARSTSWNYPEHIGFVALGAHQVATAAYHSIADLGESVARASRAAECVAQCELLREIIGNPFRTVTLDPCCKTPTVVAASQHIYGARAFSLMPRLGDTLEAVGCENVDILSHCRGAGPHVRGCWVVDLILYKT